MEAREFFNSLIGLPIFETRRKLGGWWVVTSSCATTGIHHLERAAGGYLELRTDADGKVVRERHNLLAEIYQKNDL